MEALKKKCASLLSTVRYSDFFSEKVLFEGDSPYSHVKVVEDNGVRMLVFGFSDTEHETAYNLIEPDESVFEYPCLMAPALALKPDTKELLLIGLGGGYLPRIIQKFRPDICITAVELDPLVAKLAEEFFAFTPNASTQVVIGDGREFLERAPARYDQIWVDAYDGTYIPAHMTTLEFIELCREHLVPHGVLVQNVHAAHPLFMAQQATLTEVFGWHVLIRGERGGNAVFMAQKDTARPESLKKAFSPGLKRHGVRLGCINLKHELKKAILTEYTDLWAILRDE